MMQKTLFGLLCTALLFGGASGVLAQSATTGQITGTIYDPQGAVIAGAKVTLESKAGVRREATSDSGGEYLLTMVPAGAYQMTVTAQGFKEVNVSNVVVKVTETTDVHVTLQIAAAPGERITVTAEPPLVQANSPTTGRTVEETTIRQLPLPTRNFQQLLTLSAGTSGSIQNSSELGRGDATFSVNGQRTTSNNVLINGVEANSIGTGSTPNIAVPATDSIQEFIVQTSLYDASLGRNTGGVVAAVTKSGSNEVHGNAYYFLRNTSLNANNFFLNRVGIDRPRLDRHQYGGTLGGPIVKDKAWFFGSYQGTREKNGASLLNSLSTVFVPGNLTNDRTSAGLATLATQFGLGAGPFTCTFPAPDPCIHPTAVTILRATLPGGQLLIPSAPSPTTSTTAVPLSIPATSEFRENQFNANLDVQLTNSNRLMGKFFYADNPTSQALFSFAGVQNALQAPGFPTALGIEQRLISVADTHIFTPALLNDARFGFSYIRVISTPQEPFTAAQFGIASPLSTLFPGMPTLSFTNMFDIGASPLGDSDSNVRTMSFADTLTWTKGRHTVKIGGEFKRNEVNLLFNAYNRGQIFFLGFTGNVFRDFLRGVSGLSIIGSGVNNRNIRSNDMGFFVQDDWRVNSRFTVNIGLRWDYYGPFTDTKGRLVAFDESLATTLPIIVSGFATPVAVTAGFVQAGNASTALAGIPKVQDGLVDADWNNLGPRFGFAWDLIPGTGKGFWGSSRVVMRGGYGMYFDRMNARFINNQVLSFPYYTLALSPLNFLGTANINSPFMQVPLPSTFPYDFTNATLFPFAAGPPAVLTVGAGPATAPVPANGIYPDRHNFRTPYVQQFNLGLQWGFVQNWLLDVSYVGTAGRKLNRMQSANQMTSPGLSTTGPLTPALSNLPLPGFGVQLIQTSGNSEYNSLQVSLTKRYSAGLQFLASYTYGHALDNYSGAASGVSDVSLEAGNQRVLNNYGSSDFDRRHRLVFSGTYDLPKFYSGGSAIAKGIANNWQLGAIVTTQTGTPFSVLASASAFVSTRADFAAGASADTATLSGSVHSRLGRYFDTAAFANPSGTGNFGLSGRNILRGPDQRNVDFSVVKFFPVHERVKLEFRTEFFNLTNTPSFANPVNVRSSASFGQIVRTSTGPRVIQFAFKIGF